MPNYQREKPNALNFKALQSLCEIDGECLLWKGPMINRVPYSHWANTPPRINVRRALWERATGEALGARRLRAVSECRDYRCVKPEHYAAETQSAAWARTPNTAASPKVKHYSSTAELFADGPLDPNWKKPADAPPAPLPDAEK